MKTVVIVYNSGESQSWENVTVRAESGFFVVERQGNVDIWTPLTNIRHCLVHPYNERN